MANIPAIQKFGLVLLDQYDLVSKRCNIKFEDDFSYENISEEWLINLLSPYFNSKPIKKVTYFTRQLADKNDLKFHIDNCQLVTRKEPPTYNVESYISISENKYLYHQDPLPNYTCVLYFSEYGKDFQGGEFRFADNTTITPKKGTGIMFDSREAHMVKPVISGSRTSIVVKIYLD